uniref:non-specific serine/threonine protein kinase n=1 Tax=Hucho hucho TaxID=62062 RepID=A0A4W5PJN2_9TELE
ENCHIKIADFGLSNLYHKDELLQTFCGSPLYASPEIVNGRPYHGPEGSRLPHRLIVHCFPARCDLQNTIAVKVSVLLTFHSLPDARGLIRWMLMVNPERRATVEDIANHWWVNWGWKTTVCDCDIQKDNTGCTSSPTLARFIDWQNRTTESPRVAPVKPPRSEPPAVPPHAGRQRLRKSRKENDSGMVPTLPKKGILKNNQQRESGYYSSPERSESSELLGGSTSMAPPASSPTKRSMGRKGILKRNGKYGNSTSFHSGLSNMGYHGETQGDSGLSRSQSRPSSIVCEEMGLSSVPPLMGMDWSPSSPQPNVRACMSAEDLLQLAGFRRGLQTAAGGLHGGKVGTRGTPGSPGDDSSFSLLGDMDDMTQVYQHALDINSKLT